MRFLAPTLLVLVGCAKTVAVAVPVDAAVDVETASVAVVAADASCHAVADQLARAFSATVTVDPMAPTRVAVVGCSETLVPTVSIGSNGKRSHGWEGRSSALIVVERDGVVLGRLIGTGGDGSQLLPSHRSKLRVALRDDLVTDVADQVAPSGWIERRVYPNAAPDSPRGLETRAIAAEATGDVDQALDLAIAAHALSPTPRLAAYVGELERRLHLSD